MTAAFVWKCEQKQCYRLFAKLIENGFPLNLGLGFIFLLSLLLSSSEEPAYNLGKRKTRYTRQIFLGN